MSLSLGDIAVFDCRIAQLPSVELVVAYFQWRQADAGRNALNTHCYWTLREEGKSATEATQALLGLSVADKHDLLFKRGINFNDLPAWQKRGVGLYWETYTKEGFNPLTGERTESSPRRRLEQADELPLADAYEAFMLALLDS